MPQCLLLVEPEPSRRLPSPSSGERGGWGTNPPDPTPRWFASFGQLHFTGIPNRLSTEHRSWPAIGEVAVATLKPRTAATEWHIPEGAYLEEEVQHSAATTIRQRRSALSFDGRTGLSRSDFFAILDKTQPRRGSAPFDLGVAESCVHLFLFVHRVEGVTPGLYCLLRNDTDLEDLRRECSAEFLWRKVTELLPLYLLQEGNYQDEAAQASCDQEIAGDGAFACAMVARFRSVLEDAPWRYRHLHWEAGMIGQVLYLEGEAHGMSGTGIGCFFDDVTHNLLGLTGDRFQDIYHFTVGKAVNDPRLTTLPPYKHLQKA